MVGAEERMGHQGTINQLQVALAMRELSGPGTKLQS